MPEQMPPPPAGKPALRSKSAAREARLSAALRENLKRRKVAARAREEATPDTPIGANKTNDQA